MGAASLIRVDYQKFSADMARAMAGMKGITAKIKKAEIAAVNKVATRTSSFIAKGIVKKIRLTQAYVKKQIKIKRGNAGQLAVTAEVTLSKLKRVSLINFGAVEVGVKYRKGTRRRLAKSGGVKYQIQRGGGSKFIGRAFIAKLRGKRDGKDNLHVMVRTGPGKYGTWEGVSGPLKGPTPWGVFVKSGMRRETTEQAKAWLKKELQEQIRVAGLRRAGIIRSRS